MSQSFWFYLLSQGRGKCPAATAGALFSTSLCLCCGDFSGDDDDDDHDDEGVECSAVWEGL